MNIALDYSGGRPTGNQVRASGAIRVVRYAGIGSSGKRLTKAEYQSHAAAGVRVDLVAEALTTDADSGYNAGVANAQKLEADRIAFGMPVDTIMYAANDKPSYNAADVDYVRGFRDVVGLVRAGGYGFASFLAAVRAAGYASSYWQAGPAPSRTGTSAFVGLWQRQGGAVNLAVDGPGSPTIIVVGGIDCDVNNILKEAAIEMELSDKVTNPQTGATLANVNDTMAYTNIYVSQLINADLPGKLAALSAKLDAGVSTLSGEISQEQAAMLAAVAAVSSPQVELTDAQAQQAITALSSSLQATLPPALWNLFVQNVKEVPTS